MPKPKLPAWAEAQSPIDMDQCAVVMGVSRRWLIDLLKQYPFYELRGRRKLFYPEHVEALREALRQAASARAHAPLPITLITRRSTTAAMARVRPETIEALKLLLPRKRKRGKA